MKVVQMFRLQMNNISRRFFALSKWARIGIVCFGVVLLMMSTVAWWSVSLLVHNRQVSRSWDDWTEHLSAFSTYWGTPTNTNLHKFASESKSYQAWGSTLPLWGYKDDDGSVIIEPRFSPCAEKFFGELAWAADPFERKSGYINPDGSWAIVVNGYTNSKFLDGMGQFQIIGSDRFPLYGFVNRDGKEVVPPVYRYATYYVDGYVYVEKRTWLGRTTDQLSLEFGVGIGTYLDRRAYILDKDGMVTDLPRK